MTAALTSIPLVQYRGLIWNFAQRDLKSKFKGTAVGWGWSLILPLATLGIYTLITHYIFRADPPRFGNGHKGNYATFLFIGLTGWGLFANSVNTAMAALVGTGPLLKKIYFPAYTPVLGAVIAVMIQSGIEIGLVLVVLVIFTNVGVSWLLLPVWLALFVVFTSAVSIALALANIFFRDLAHLIGVFLQLLFYATPILYAETLIDQIPVAAARIVMKANPPAQFIDIFRDIVYGLNASTWKHWAMALAWTAIAVGAAAWVQVRHGRDLAEEL